MRRLAAFLMIMGAAVGGSAVANASSVDTDRTTTANQTTGAPGYSLEVTVTGCEPGETVTATLAGVSGSGTCAAASGNGLFLSAATNNGTAVIPLTAPSTPGTYTITPNGSVTGAFPAVTITVQATTTTAGPTTTVGPTTTGVPADDLPETGSSTGPTVMIAAVLLLAGIGMFAVAQVRRRQAETPA